MKVIKLVAASLVATTSFFGIWYVANLAIATHVINQQQVK